MASSVDAFCPQSCDGWSAIGIRSTFSQQLASSADAFCPQSCDRWSAIGIRSTFSQQLASSANAFCPQSCNRWSAIGCSNRILMHCQSLFPQLIKAKVVESGLARCAEITKEIRRKKLDEGSGDAVLFTVAPTRIHVVRKNPCRLLFQHTPEVP